ncbi:Hypothetical_protein [Hexamita inflata]|uniref:Hypothetical_protein n=1 Tax=Hexamita inflata TaxID=28002 RepID=A0AA86TDD6_9EUKA|nr:Hypothetical protein HINF_LOCUS2116 [Hexamita inflata]
MIFSQNSVGEIFLIKTVEGVLNIQSYQVLGKYISQQRIALVAGDISNSNVSIQYYLFNISSFSIGNLSSYMISNSSQSTVSLKQIFITKVNLNLQNSISSISSSTNNQMQFGGFIAISISSKVYIKDVTFQQYDLWTVSFTQLSGQIIGLIKGVQSKIQIQQLCVDYQLYSNASTNSFYGFGLIGYVEGVIMMKNANINYKVLSQGLFNEFGSIGITSNNCQNIKLNDMYIQFKMENNYGYNISSLIASQLATNWSIYEITINNSCVIGVRTGFISGRAYNNGTIENIQVFSSLSYANGTLYHSFSASIIGIIEMYAQIKLIYVKTIKINVSSISSSGWCALAGTIIGEQQPSGKLIITNILVNDSIVLAKATVDYSCSGGIISKLFGQVIIQYCNVTNTTINSSQQLQNVSYAGSFVSYVLNTGSTQLQVNTCYSNSTNIFGKADNISYVGGMVGYSHNSIIDVSNVVILNIFIMGQSLQIQSKITVNYYLGTIQIVNSQSLGINVINNAQVGNCVFNNIYSQSGC